MRTFALAAALAVSPVHADLFRWVDPETGSIKYSSTPPAWYGDPERERTSPPVEVVPYRGPGAPPPKAAAVPEKPAAPAGVAALEARWGGLLQFLSTLAPGTDLARPDAALREQLAAYQAVGAELNRLDPAGAERRRAQETAAFAKAAK